jgi:hypothetical protein
MEIIFASTGTKKPSDAPWKYVEATLMEEGIAKFANPQKSLLAMVAKKRQDVG